MLAQYYKTLYRFYN